MAVTKVDLEIVVAGIQALKAALLNNVIRLSRIFGLFLTILAGLIRRRRSRPRPRRRRAAAEAAAEATAEQRGTINPIINGT